MVLGRATTLIWLDLPEDECIANIRHRGGQGGGSQTRFQDLLQWVVEYRIRKNNWNSFDIHKKLYELFPGPKVLLGVWMRDLLGGSDDLEGWRQRV
jgi:hypothetical protein